MRKTFIWVTLILAVAMGGSAQVTEFPIPTSNSGPLGITRGPDGNVWFTENGAKKIGRISMTGTVTEFPLPLPFSDPRGITARPRRKSLVHWDLSVQHRPDDPQRSSHGVRTHWRFIATNHRRP